MLKSIIFSTLFFIANSALSQRLSVFVFMNTECPISQKMTLHLQQLKEQNSTENINWVLVFTDKKISKNEINKFKKEYLVNSWKSINDRRLKISKKYKATVTPEAILLNDKKEIIYQGAINNWYYEWGKNRAVITEFYLREAIVGYLKNKTVSIPKTEAIGCWISY